LSYALYACQRPPSSGQLLARVVDGVVRAARPGDDELGDGQELIALLQQIFNDGGQSLRGVEGGVVEEYDGAGLHLGGDPLGDVGGGEVFPVQTVTTDNKGKAGGDRKSWFLLYNGKKVC